VNVNVQGMAETGSPAGGAEQGGTLRLCIYVTGGSPASRQALGHLSGVLDALGIPGEHLTVVDVLRDPTAAFAAGVVVTPALRVERADRAQWFLGDLTRRDQLARFLA
jgi:hypothetical protein